MEVPVYVTHHLIKGEDLNHHGTLFAGRSAEWFVESGFIAAASLTHPENTLCVKIHGMQFSRPVQKGEILRFTSKIILAGRTSMVAYVEADVRGERALTGFLTFVHVDSAGRPDPHHLEIVPVLPEDIALQEEARALPR